jgi:hypothetical protein
MALAADTLHSYEITGLGPSKACAHALTPTSR